MSYVMYTISINKPNKTCKVHMSNCKSLKQVIGNKATLNQVYIENLQTCTDIRNAISQNGLSGCTRCKKCVLANT